MRRKNIFSGAKWEPLAGYSRAVRIDNWVQVAGTTATDSQGHVTGVGDAYAQTVQILKNIERALNQAGAALEDVVRTRVYCTNMADWEKISQAHHEFFKNIHPACTLVGVKALIMPELLVEIEADAVI